MDWNVLGHEWAVRLLQQHITRGEVRHAYLFSGPPGVGRRTLALRFAQALNCPQPPAPGEPCGTCRTCLQIERMQHADLSLIQAETVGGTLKVEQVRDLQRSLSLSPYEASYRVALLLRFEEANASAQNALLKTLEEAPTRAVLFLTAVSPESLLPTITSRCEILRLRPMGPERLSEELHQRWDLPADEARYLAHLSDGRVGAALHLHEEPDLLEQRRILVTDLLELLGATRIERFSYAEGLAKDKEHMRQVLLVWLSFWRDVLLVRAGSSAALVNLEQLEDIRQLAAHIELSTARARTADLEQTISRLDYNINSRLLAEVLLLDWPMIEEQII